MTMNDVKRLTIEILLNDAKHLTHTVQLTAKANVVGSVLLIYTKNK